MDDNVTRPEIEAANGSQEKHVFIYTLHGIRRLKCLWMSGGEPEHTVVSHEAAQRYSLRVDSRRQDYGTDWGDSRPRHGLQDVSADG